MARPMPRLPPVTMATCPDKPSLKISAALLFILFTIYDLRLTRRNTIRA
jgi:hypothetical protein